jgi:hypothetical protein
VYFKIDDSFKTDAKMDASVKVEFYDGAPGRLGVEFDGSDPNAPFAGAYTACKTVENLSGSKTWKSAVFHLTDAVFSGSQNGGADFRLNINTPEFYVRKVQLARNGLKVEAYSRQIGFRMALFGDPADPCELQTSSNLRDWRTMTRLRPTLDGASFTDNAARGQPHGWYRASQEK